VRAGLDDLEIQHVAEERAALAGAVVDVAFCDLAPTTEFPQLLAARSIEADNRIRPVAFAERWWIVNGRGSHRSSVSTAARTAASASISPTLS
jgi:hypothetical protein